MTNLYAFVFEGMLFYHVDRYGRIWTGHISHLPLKGHYIVEYMVLICPSNTVKTFNSCTSRPDVWQCLIVQTPMNKRSTSTTHVVCESKLHLVLRSSMPCTHTQDWVAIRLAFMYYAQAAHAFSAGITCRHCIVSTPRGIASDLVSFTFRAFQTPLQNARQMFPNS